MVLDATGDAGNRWIFTDLLDQGLEPWTGIRWVAIAGSQFASHAVDVSNSLEPAIASLAEHKLYLEALADRPAAEQAREWIGRVTQMAADRFGGVPTVAFELIGR